MERGQGDGDIGTRVWGLILGMRDEGLGNIKYGTRGCMGQGRGTLNTYRDVGTSNMGRRGTLMIISKVRVINTISLLRENVLFIVNIRFHRPEPHWTPYDVNTKYFLI